MKDPPLIRPRLTSSRVEGQSNDAYTELLMPPSDHGNSPYVKLHSKLAKNHVSEAQYELPEHIVQQVDVGNRRTVSWDPNGSAHSANFTDWNVGIGGGIENHAEATQRNTHQLEGHSHDLQSPVLQNFPYKPSPGAQFPYSEPIAFMQSPYDEANSSFAQTETFTSQYRSFTNTFKDSQSASDFRKIATRFERRPYRPPDADPTIEQIRRDRLHHVSRIYNALIRSDAAKDNGNSIAMRRWVHSAYYPAGLVEAYSHKILDCTLDQAENGFRGWNHNDYSQDERKGDDEDKHVNCATRLDNIIRGLEEEKTICEDVMSSACQIRMFVNAPKAYAARKQANRVGNSKRGRNKAGPDTEVRGSPRGSRARKTHFRNAASQKAPISNANESPPRQLYGTLPRNHASPLPTVSSPLARHVYPACDLAVRSEANHLTDAAYPSPSQATMSPPSQVFPRFNSMPRASHAPLLSPPLPTHHYQSFNLPMNSEHQRVDSIGISSSWPPSTAESVGGLAHQSLSHMDDCIDPVLLQNLDQSGLASPSQYPEEMFQFDEPAFNLPAASMGHANVNLPASTDSFHSYWSNLDGVQQFPPHKIDGS